MPLPLQPARRITPQICLALITIAVLAPFLNKAFHIDDPLFIWMAQQIAKHPLDPYRFDVNWVTSPRPMWQEMQNPPLCSYFIAFIGSTFGWSEIALHTAFVIWAVAAILGIYRLARVFCDAPAFAALLTICTPVFLVSATNVMCDVMLLAFFLWALVLWIEGLNRDRGLLLLGSALLISAAVLTKYFGIALVPLLAAYTLAGRSTFAQPQKVDGFKPSSLRGLFYLLIPIAITVAYELLTRSMYDRGLFLGAAIVSKEAWSKFHLSLVGQSIVGLAFTGGCIATLAFFVRGSKFFIALMGLIGAGIAIFCLLLPLVPGWVLEPNPTFVQIEGGIFVGIGLALILLAAADLYRTRDRASLLLFLWVTGTFAFATFFNWSITSRTILPLVPTTAILVVRNFAPRLNFGGLVQLSLAAALTLAITAADFRQANCAREAARAFQQRFEDESRTVWFQSHWGFQFYMQQWRAKLVDSRRLDFRSGDVIIIPENNTSVVPIDLERVFPPEQLRFATMPWLTTFGRGTGACFYSSIRGPIPWAINHVPPEIYFVTRFR